MAALDTAQTVFQPTPGAGPIGIDAFDKQASFLSSLASQQSQFAGQLWNNASSAFNNAYDIYSKDAERRAAEDAPALIKHDGDNNIIPPSSFYPPGISTKAYAETYRNTALALYRTSAEQELANHSDLLKQQFPSDPDAYNAGMEKKRQAMQVSLDPTQRGWVDLRGAQIQSQGATQIQVRNQSDANALHSATAAEKYAGIVDDATRLAAFQAGAATGFAGQTPEQINDMITNSAALGQRWKDQVAIWQAAGQSPAFIEDQRRKLGQNVIIKYAQETIKHSYAGFFDPATGYPNPAKIADARLNIEAAGKAFAEKFPGHEKEYTDAMESALQFATGQSSLRAQQVQIDDKKRMLPQQREMQADAAEAQRLKFSNEPDALARSQAITEKLEQRGRDYLKNTQISDSVAMELAGTAFQTGAISRAAYDQGNTNRLVGLNATVKDPAIPFEQKTAAFENAREIRNNPEIYRNLNPGQRSYLQGTMDDYVKMNYGMQLQAYNSEILKGDTSPAEIAKTRAEQVAKGIIQPEQIVAVGQIDAAANAKYQEKQTQSLLATQHLDNFSKGVPSTPTQVDAAKKELRLTGPPDGKPMDYNNPAHLQWAKDTYQKYGILPDAAKAGLDAMPHSPDDNVIAPQKAMFTTIKQVERQQMEKLFGATNWDDDKENLLAGKVASIVGSNNTYLALSTKFNAQTANKMDVAFGGEPSKAGAQGQTADQAKQNVGTAFDKLAPALAGVSLNKAAQLIRDPGLMTRSEADTTPEQKVALEIAKAAPGGLMSSKTYETIKFDPNFRNAMVENGVIHLANDGKSINAMRPNNGESESFVASTALFTALRDGKAGITVSPDGKTATIGWKTLGQHVSEAINQPMDKDMERSFAAGMISAQNMRVGGDLQSIDASRVFTVPYQGSDGQMRYRISMQDRNGNLTQLEDMAQSDPRVSLLAMNVIKATQAAIVAKAADPETYGKIVAGGAVASGIGAVALLKDHGDVVNNFIQMSTTIGQAIHDMQLAVNSPEQTRLLLSTKAMLTPGDIEARTNMQVDYARQLKALNDQVNEYRNKYPNAPNLKEIIDEMVQQHAPGLDSSAMRQMVLENGLGRTGPPTRTGPSRIGTESR